MEKISVDNRNISLCETLDRVLNTGVVVNGEITISVANVDLLYLNLGVLLTSIETMNKLKSDAAIKVGAGI
ncbi:MAG: gas vesicle protein [Planctomycetota bacterium]